MATDPMLRLPPLPSSDGADHDAAHDKDETRDTAPPALAPSAGLPFRRARRDTPTMVSAPPPKRAQTINLAHPPAVVSALPFKPAQAAPPFPGSRIENALAPARRIPTPPATPAAAPAVPFKPVASAKHSSRPPAAPTGLPFRSGVATAPAARERSSRLTLEQFASLAAELAVWPAAAAQIRARYRLDEAAQLDEHAIWQVRFSNDRDLFARYAALFQHYRRWLESQRP